MNVFRWGLKEGPIRTLSVTFPHLNGKNLKTPLEIRDETMLAGLLKNLSAPYAGESYRDRMCAVCVLPFMRQVRNADGEKRRKR